MRAVALQMFMRIVCVYVLQTVSRAERQNRTDSRGPNEPYVGVGLRIGATWRMRLNDQDGGDGGCRYYVLLQQLILTCVPSRRL